MTSQKRIIAGLCALVALIAISAAIKLAILGNSEKAQEHRAEVSPPSESAPDWVEKGQQATPDYSAADMQPNNTTRATEEKQNTATESQVMADESPTADAPKVVEEDKIIGFPFIDSLTNHILSRFQPGRDSKQPATKASFRSLNMYFSRNFDGIRIDAGDIKENRSRLFDYVFTPTGIKTLYMLYADLFVEQLSDTTTQVVDGEERNLTREEMSDLFRLNAATISRTATVFKAVADNPALLKLTAQYIQAVRAVERANVRFQESLSSTVGDQEKADAGNKLKQAIRERERLRGSIVSRIKKSCRECPDDEVFYIALWSYRRTLGSEKKLSAFAVAAETLEDLAKRFETKADNLMQPE